MVTATVGMVTTVVVEADAPMGVRDGPGVTVGSGVKVGRGVGDAVGGRGVQVAGKVGGGSFVTITMGVGVGVMVALANIGSTPARVSPYLINRPVTPTPTARMPSSSKSRHRQLLPPEVAVSDDSGSKGFRRQGHARFL